MTAICSFIGHSDIYDVNIQSKMQTVVDQIISEHEAVEFLIYPAGDFSYAFLLAVLRARTNYPQKVTISFLSEDITAKEIGTSLELPYLYYMSDKLVTLDIQASKNNDVAMKYKKKLKWIVPNSTHIISYFYDTLYDPDRQSVKNSQAQEISLSTPETETVIMDFASRMTEKEKIIFQKMNEGCTLKEAGSTIGVGAERARQILQHGCRTLRVELRQRYSRALAAEQKMEGRSCGLFALGEATYDSLIRFKRIMSFLISTYQVNSVFVEQSYAHSGFMFALDSSMPFITRHKPHITALVRDKDLPEDGETMDATKAMLCPPCQAVGYVRCVDSSDFDVIADMIERADFCICDLSATPDAEKIRKYAAQTKRTVLLDISNSSVRNKIVQRREVI